MVNGKNTTNLEGYVTIGAAAQLLGTSIDTIRRWERAGKLNSERLDGKNRYFLAKDLEVFAHMQKLSTGEVAKLLGISEATIRRLQATGVLTAERSSTGKRLFDPEQVREYAKLRQQAKPMQNLPAPTKEAITQQEVVAEPEVVRASENQPEPTIKPAQVMTVQTNTNSKPSTPKVAVASVLLISCLRTVKRTIIFIVHTAAYLLLLVKRPARVARAPARPLNRHYRANQDVYKGLFALIAMLCIIAWLIFSD
jgi:excisionase family DNA binding protein